MGAAPLPGRAGQVHRDGLDQAGARVRGDEPHAGPAAGHEVGEELVPRRAGLGRGHAHAEHLAVPVAVEPGHDHDDGVDGAPALADLYRQGVGRHERERSRLGQRAVPERLDLGVEVLSHPGHCDFDNKWMPRVLTSLSIPRVDTRRGSSPATTVMSADSDRLRRSSSHSGKYVPVRSFEIATSMVPSGCPGRGGASRCAARPGSSSAGPTRRRPRRRRRSSGGR